MQLVIDLWALMRWTQLIMVFSSSLLMTQEFMRCSLMLMVRSLKNNKCSTRQELVVSEILKPQTKDNRTKHKWETPCIMVTSWKTSDKAMLANKMWIISKLSSIKEDNHLSKWTIRTSPTQVTEMEPAHLALTQAVLATTESVQLTVLPKIIKPICSIWWIRGKHQMETKINNKWWWQPNNSSTQHQTTINRFLAWIPLVKTPLKPTLT